MAERSKWINDLSSELIRLDRAVDCNATYYEDLRLKKISIIKKIHENCTYICSIYNDYNDLIRLLYEGVGKESLRIVKIYSIEFSANIAIGAMWHLGLIQGRRKRTIENVNDELVTAQGFGFKTDERPTFIAIDVINFILTDNTTLVDYLNRMIRKIIARTRLIYETFIKTSLIDPYGLKGDGDYSDYGYGYRYGCKDDYKGDIDGVSRGFTEDKRKTVISWMTTSSKIDSMIEDIYKIILRYVKHSNINEIFSQLRRDMLAMKNYSFKIFPLINAISKAGINEIRHYIDEIEENVVIIDYHCEKFNEIMYNLNDKVEKMRIEFNQEISEGLSLEAERKDVEASIDALYKNLIKKLIHDMFNKRLSIDTDIRKLINFVPPLSKKKGYNIDIITENCRHLSEYVLFAIEKIHQGGFVILPTEGVDAYDMRTFGW